MNRKQAVEIVKEILGDCCFLEAISIQLLPPRDNVTLSNTVQIHIRTEDSARASLKSCIQRVAEKHNLGTHQDGSYFIVFKPHPEVEDERHINMEDGKKRRLPRRISLEEIQWLARAVWENSTVADEISIETFEIIAQAAERKLSFFSGKSTKGLIGGLFYLVGSKREAQKTQKEIAALLKTNDVTLRTSYQKWLQEFPDFFPKTILRARDFRSQKTREKKLFSSGKLSN